MVLVVCPNLAIDYTLRVDKLRPGQVHRSLSYQRQAGGKGVNTARALRTLGRSVLICGLAGGSSGHFIECGLADERLPARLVPMSSENRTCVIVLSADGEATVVNESGPTLSESGDFLDVVSGLLPDSEAVAMMGSLPPGMPADSYARLVRRCRDADIPCLVDTSGPALRDALEEKPTFAKPNRAEAEELLGRSISDEIAAARELRILGPQVVILTLGDQGAILSTAEVEGRLLPPAATPENATGAGDALAAGLLDGHLSGGSPQDAARLGVAAAAASLKQGYGRFARADVRMNEVEFQEL